MKLKVVFALVISLIFALGLAGVAGAVNVQPLCDSVTFSHGTAQPGGSETVCGSVPGGGVNVTLNFDGSQVGSAVSDQYGEYCITFTVPASATAGTHLLGFLFAQGESSCQRDYVVEAAAIAPAAAVPTVATLPATLPSTGFMLIPAGGLIAGGLGTLLFRKRRC